MPEISVDKLIGRNLTTNKQVNAYSEPNVNSKKLFVIKQGGLTGKVYSWIERNDGVWLMFQRSGGGFYYILALPKTFKSTEAIKQIYKIEKAAEEQQIVEEKGKLPYYIEKYGKWVLGAIVLVVVAREFIKKKA